MSKINIQQRGDWVMVYTSGVTDGVYFSTRATVREVRAAKQALSGTVREKAMALKAQFAGK